jgi:hypothetical protein
MKTSQRWLIIFGSLLAILTIAVVSVALINSGKEESLLAADTPQGTVQRFLLAYRNHDYQQAETYLDLIDAGVGSPGDAWRQATLNPPPENGWKATLVHTDIFGDQASVTVEISVFRATGAMASPVTNEVSFGMTRQDNIWFITGLPYIWWPY